MTTEEIKKIFSDYDKLDPVLKYWLFEKFVLENMKDIDYLLEFVKYKKENQNVHV